MNGEEVVRCPYCGRLTQEGQVEKPADYCHHDVVEPKKPEPCEVGTCKWSLRPTKRRCVDCGRPCCASHSHGSGTNPDVFRCVRCHAYAKAAGG